ncbi:hypothetical protein F4677DRAFT_457768 [Hypoxylon crocopeplum]|nr:hypothetical protein F4677DRAFT_457768 [Hypoxylon crocopeplum]
MLPLFDITGDVQVAFSTEERIPKKWGGLIAVLAMVSMYLICVWIITTLYVRNVRYTRQGNCWHAVSQLMSKPTQFILKQSNELRDKHIENMLKGDDPLVTINQSTNTGKVEVLEYKTTEGQCRSLS